MKLRNRSKFISRENRVYKWCLSERVTLLKKSSFRECFNRKWKEALTDMAPPRVFLARKAVIKNVKNVYEIIFYLKSQYLPHNEEQRTFVQDIPSQEDIPSFEAIVDYLKTFSKSIKKKLKIWLWRIRLYWVVGYQRQRNYFRRDKRMGEKTLPGRFEDWLYKEYKIKKQTIYNYRNLYKLMSIAQKLMNCRVNMTYFKTTKFFLIILKKMKGTYLGNITFIVHTRLVSYTFWRINDISFNLWYNLLLKFYL